MVGVLGLPGVDFLLTEAIGMTALSVACYFGWVE
jgi:hypothetical protein